MKERMGTFYAGCVVANFIDRSRAAEVPKLLVDSGSECTWIAAETLAGIGIAAEKKDMQFLMANGGTITRTVGFAILRVGERFTVDEVVFAQGGDLQLLGARTLEGLNLIVDPARKCLIAAGPLPAAVCA
jgi:predicted aspartyl protease